MEDMTLFSDCNISELQQISLPSLSIVCGSQITTIFYKVGFEIVCVFVVFEIKMKWMTSDLSKNLVQVQLF